MHLLVGLMALLRIQAYIPEQHFITKMPSYINNYKFTHAPTGRVDGTATNTGLYSRATFHYKNVILPVNTNNFSLNSLRPSDAYMRQ